MIKSKEQAKKNKREVRKFLKEYEKEFGQNTCVFIPKDEEGYKVIEANLEYTIQELEEFKKQSIERIEMQIKFYKKVLKSK